MGDFNEFMSLSEQWGAISKTRRQMEDFQKVLEECTLSDLGFKGPKFTWNNGWLDDAFTQECLDRVMANPEWCLAFAGTKVKVLARYNYDHNHLLLCVESDGLRRGRGRPFRVEASWELHPEFKDEVGKYWKKKPKRDNPLQSVHGKL